MIRRCLSVLISIVALNAMRESFAQVSQENDELRKYKKRFERTENKEAEKPKPRPAESSRLLQALERPIDPAQYVVGPGDVLEISFWGSGTNELGFSAIITPEGKLIIPTVGALDVIDKPLAQVQQEVRQAAASKYDPRKISVTAHLTQLRQARAHVYGEVGSPGSYIGTAVDRVSSFIQQAEGWTEWADERRVELRHADGRVDTLDMFELYHEGDLRQDPYIRGGEIIYAPRVEFTEKTVFVEGEAGRPGPHQIVKDEALLHFLFRVEALTRNGELGEVFLIRQGQAPVRINLFANGSAAEDAHRVLMQHGDRVIVKGSKDFVYVHGAVKNPGNYPYIEGYRVADYLGFAGGTQEAGDPGRAKVIHRDSGKTEKGMNKEVRRGDTIIVPLATRTTISNYLLIASYIATLLIAARAVGLIGATQ